MSIEKILIKTMVGLAYATWGTRLLVRCADVKLDQANICIDKQKVFIKCFSEGLSYVNFKTFVQCKEKSTYLYIKGTSIKDSTQEIVSVEHRYLLKNVTSEELAKRKTYIEPDYRYPRYVVEIPLDSVKKVSVKRKDKH